MILEERADYFDGGASNLLASSIDRLPRTAPAPLLTPTAPAPAQAPPPAKVATYSAPVDDVLAMPTGSAVNSSLSLTGSEFSAAPTIAGANDPGLNSKSVFSNAEGNGKMTSTHWLLIVVGIVAVLWALFHFGILGSTTSAA